MAVWYGTSRSNYFRVKDEAAFREWAMSLNIGIFQNDQDAAMFALHPGEHRNDGSWPNYNYEEREEIHFINQLSAHLATGQIAVLMTAGAENMRYVTGDAVAVNPQGQVVSISLNDIYLKAARRFRVPQSSITLAEY
jgi:hypothetical protein